MTSVFQTIAAVFFTPVRGVLTILALVVVVALSSEETDASNQPCNCNGCGTFPFPWPGPIYPPVVTPPAPTVPDGQINVAGNLLVDLHANDLSVSPGASVLSWRNDGDPAVGDFSGAGSTAPVFAQNMQGSNAVLFDGRDFVNSAANVPSTVHGNNSWSLETWILNPSIQHGVEEIYFQWGRRGGPNGTSGTAHYADQGDGPRSNFAAVSHWGWTDMGWGIDGVPDSSKMPPANAWHHFAITFDGFTELVYVDGNLTPVNAENKTLLINQDKSPLRFSLGSAIYASSSGGGAATISWSGQPLGFSGYVAALRMHSGVLSGDAIQGNYSAGIGAQNVPEPASVTLAGVFAAFGFASSFRGRDLQQRSARFRATRAH